MLSELRLPHRGHELMAITVSGTSQKWRDRSNASGSVVPAPRTPPVLLALTQPSELNADDVSGHPRPSAGLPAMHATAMTRMETEMTNGRRQK